MKKLIVPIIIGLVMFGAAFGGAFYFFRSEKAKEEAAIGSITDNVLAALQKRGKEAVYITRVVAVAAPAAVAEPTVEDAPKAGSAIEHGAPAAGKTEAAAAKPPPPSPAPALSSMGGGFAIVPATVRYELDYRAIRRRDVVWDENQRMVKITLPALTIAEPEIDGAQIRQIGGSAPQAAIRKGALGGLLSQAREEATLGRARETTRLLIQLAFSYPMQIEGIRKVKLAIRFADEPAENADSDEH